MAPLLPWRTDAPVVIPSAARPTVELRPLQSDPAVGLGEIARQISSLRFPLPASRQTLPWVRLIDRLAITDTGSHRPNVLLNLNQAVSWVFEVNNQLDQSVTIHLVGAFTDDPGNAGDVGLSATIAATTVEPVVLDASNLWTPFSGLRAVCPVAPSAGFVTVRGAVQVERQ